MSARGLLLDRDGVVNVDNGYVGAAADFVFMDGIFPLARRAVGLGYRLIVVTNQSGVARGYYDEAAFMALTRWMAARFADEGAPLTDVLYCPYLAGAPPGPYARDSFWRKPNPGMMLEAARRFGVDLSRSAMIGDQPTDMTAARRAGVGRRIFFDNAKPDAKREDGARACPDATVRASTLAEAARLLTGPNGEAVR